MKQSHNRQLPTARLAGPLATGILALLVIAALVYQQQQTIQSLTTRVAELEAQLIDSLDHSDICKKYGPCASDPAVPNGVAWGLSGLAYHARLHANCKPEVGCIPENWMGW